MKTITALFCTFLFACTARTAPDSVPCPPSRTETVYRVTAAGSPIGENGEPDNTRATALCNAGDSVEAGWCTGATQPLVSSAVLPTDDYPVGVSPENGWQCTEDNPSNPALTATALCLHVTEDQR